MEIIHGNAVKGLYDGGIACALGFFDGVHLGHANLISTLKQLSCNMNIKSMVFTFEKHPMTVLSAQDAPKMITSNEAKASIFESLGVDIVNFNPVNRDFLNYEPEDFLTDILIKKYNVRALVAGFNFKFGHLGRGDSALLKDFCIAYGIRVEIVKPVIIDGVLVSSTAIRDYIAKGNVSMACRLLGRPFSMEGTVSHGMMRGRNLGFPTANLSIDESMITPKNGVYITSVLLDGMEYKSVTNVGYNPTFKNSSISVETHIIDFCGDIYGRDIKVLFHERLRDEIKFKSIDELSKQIFADRKKAAEY